MPQTQLWQRFAAVWLMDKFVHLKNQAEDDKHAEKTEHETESNHSKQGKSD